MSGMRLSLGRTGDAVEPLEGPVDEYLAAGDKEIVVEVCNLKVGQFLPMLLARALRVPARDFNVPGARELDLSPSDDSRIYRVVYTGRELTRDEIVRALNAFGKNGSVV